MTAGRGEWLKFEWSESQLVAFSFPSIATSTSRHTQPDQISNEKPLFHRCRRHLHCQAFPLKYYIFVNERMEPPRVPAVNQYILGHV